MRRLTAVLSIIGVCILLAGCEVPAPGTPLPTVTPLPTAAPTMTPVPPSPTAAVLLPTATLTVAVAKPTAEEPPTARGPWPSRPADLASYAEAIVGFLNAAPVNIVRLRPMLWDWGAITERLGGIREADIDGDGEIEWVVAVAEPVPLALTVPGNLLVIDKKGDNYQLLYQIADPYQQNVTILATEDINADGKVELVYSTTGCGAHTCFTTVHLLAWDGAGVRSITRDQIEMPYCVVKLENRDSDAALELVLHGGMIGSVGAGPQRARTEIYDWNGTDYALAETIYDQSDFLYFAVLDANAALLAGDYTRAITLYQKAITDPSLRLWKEVISKDERERKDLVAFSRFRLILTYLLVRDDAKAEAIKEELQREQADHIYNEVARVFWEAYQKKKADPSAAISAACQAVTEFAYGHPETVDVLLDFGYANPSFTPDEICPIGIGVVTP